MQPIMPILGAACLVGATACAHVPSAEGEAHGEVEASAEEVAAFDQSASSGGVATSLQSPTPAPIAAQQAEAAPAQPQPIQAQPAPMQAQNEGSEAQAVGNSEAEASPEPAFVAEIPAEKLHDERDEHDSLNGEFAKESEDADFDKEPAFEAGEVSIARFVLTRGIEDREPTEESTSFTPGERVYAFVQAANAGGESYQLNVRWAQDEGSMSEPVALEVGVSPRWRTWTWRNAPEQPGSYRCVIETVDGEQVAEIPFDVGG